MFSASGKFSGITGSPSRGGRGCRGVSGGGRSVCSRPAPKEGRAGRGGTFSGGRRLLFSVPAGPGGGTGRPGEGGLRRSGGCSFQVRRRPSGCPRYCGLSRAEAAKRPCGCRGSADGKKFVVFHDGPPKRKKMVWHVYLFGAVPVVVADRRARPGRCRCCTGYSNRRAKVYFHNKNNKLQNKV